MTLAIALIVASIVALIGAGLMCVVAAADAEGRGQAIVDKCFAVGLGAFCVFFVGAGLLVAHLYK